MAENATNRRWVINNNLGTRTVPAGLPESAHALLYYQAQLEAELEEVRRRIREATPGR